MAIDTIADSNLCELIQATFSRMASLEPPLKKRAIKAEQQCEAAASAMLSSLLAALPSDKRQVVECVGGYCFYTKHAPFPARALSDRPWTIAALAP